MRQPITIYFHHTKSRPTPTNFEDCPSGPPVPRTDPCAAEPPTEPAAPASHQAAPPGVRTSSDSFSAFLSAAARRGSNSLLASISARSASRGTAPPASARLVRKPQRSDVISFPQLTTLRVMRMKMKIVSSTAFGTQMSFSQMCRYCTLGSRFYGQTTMLAKIRS
jgi:hypothetical protein